MNYRKVFLTAMMMAMAVMVNAQSLAVYISDNSGSATNVRNAPKGKVVAKLNANSGIMFDVESPRNGWWKISGGVYTDPDKDMDDILGALFGHRLLYKQLWRTDLASEAVAFGKVPFGIFLQNRVVAAPTRGKRQLGESGDWRRQAHGMD